MTPGTRATREWLQWSRLLKTGKLCREWQDSFCTYYADTGDIPPGYMLKRHNVRRSWGKDNCYWGKVKSSSQKSTWASPVPLSTVTGK